MLAITQVQFNLASRRVTCICALKEFIEYNKKRSTPVFVTMLNAVKRLVE